MKKLLIGFAFVVVLWMVLPTLVIVPISLNSVPSINLPIQGISLRWYEEFLTDRMWLRALTNSVLVALLTTAIATLLGVLASLGLVRLSARMSGALQNYFLAPMIIPGVVLAVGLYALFLKIGIIGTLFGFVCAHVIVALPLVIMNVLPSVASLDATLENAAASLGASRIATALNVTFPLILPGVTAGALFAFVTSFDEVVVSLFVQSPALQTLPVKMFSTIRQSTDPTTAAAAVVTMIISVGLMLGAQRLGSRNRKLKNPNSATSAE